jgi:hypothetical protein
VNEGRQGSLSGLHSCEWLQLGSAEGIKRPLSANGERKVRTPKDRMAVNGGPG